MKAYKIIKPKLGWKNPSDKLERLFNSYDNEYWYLNGTTTTQHALAMILEPDKNR